MKKSGIGFNLFLLIMVYSKIGKGCKQSKSITHLSIFRFLSLPENRLKIWQPGRRRQYYDQRKPLYKGVRGIHICLLFQCFRADAANRHQNRSTAVGDKPNGLVAEHSDRGYRHLAIADTHMDTFVSQADKGFQQKSRNKSDP